MLLTRLTLVNTGQQQREVVRHELATHSLPCKPGGSTPDPRINGAGVRSHPGWTWIWDRPNRHQG